MLTDLSNQRARTMLRTRMDHLTKVVQTLYLVYIPPNETGSPQTAHLCILPSQLPTWILLLLPSLSSSIPPGSRLPRPRLLPRPSPSLRPSSPGLPNLNDILALVFVYTLVGIFALLLLASLVYFALRCLEPPSSDP